MEISKEGLIPVGELAKRAGVTVRTLQFYDKNGLLKSTISEGGRRMYTRDDVLKLQQILFLKSFGFSLEQINDKLLSPKSPADLETIFAGQKEILLEQMGHLNKIVETLDAVIAETKTGREISLDKLMIIMDLMNQGNKYSFVIRYFKDEQLQRVTKRFDSPEKYNAIMDKSKVLFAQLESLYRQDADPAGKEGQEFAAKWWGMVNEFTGGDPNLLKPLLSAGMDVDNWPDEASSFKDAINNFLSKAIDTYLRGIGQIGKEGYKND